MGFSWRYVDHALPLHHQKTKNRNYYYEEILDHIGYCTIGTDLLAYGDSADSSSSEGVEKVWRHCRVCRGGRDLWEDIYVDPNSRLVKVNVSTY